MIAPDMATMLSFIFTDANIPSNILQTLLSRNVQNTFNAITVDSDASTSDTLLLFATGAAKSMVPTSADDPVLKDFELALQSVMLNLAKQIVCDGEGAQKLIQVDVTGATSKKSAHKIGLAIANSPLVKTAIAGGDANWGRVVMAVGKSGERLTPIVYLFALAKQQLPKKVPWWRGTMRRPLRNTSKAEKFKLQLMSVSVMVAVPSGLAT